MGITGDRPYEMTSTEMHRELRRLRKLLAECRTIVEAMAGEDCESFCDFDHTRPCWPTRARALLKRLPSR